MREEAKRIPAGERATGWHAAERKFGPARLASSRLGRAQNEERRAPERCWRTSWHEFLVGAQFGPIIVCNRAHGQGVRSS